MEQDNPPPPPKNNKVNIKLKNPKLKPINNKKKNTKNSQKTTLDKGQTTLTRFYKKNEPPVNNREAQAPDKILQQPNTTKNNKKNDSTTFLPRY